MQYIYEEYLTPVPLINDHLAFKPLSEVTAEESAQLAQMYCTLFNADNCELLKELGIQGITVPEGIWTEEPYTFDLTAKIMKDYLSGEYFGVVGYGQTTTGPTVIGATVFKQKTQQELNSKGYEIPFEIPENTDLWCAIDTFRRDAQFDNKPLKGLASMLRKKLIEIYKKENPVLMYSSSNNPVMIKSWKSDGFTVIEKDTTFGNHFQGFKLIL